MIPLEIIYAMGVLIIPIYILKFISFCVEIYKYSKLPKPKTLEEVLKENKDI